MRIDDDGSGNINDQQDTLAEIQFVEDPPKPTTIEKSGEDANNQEEFMDVSNMKEAYSTEADFTGSDMAPKDLVQNYDSDMVLESERKSIEEAFFNEPVVQNNSNLLSRSMFGESYDQPYTGQIYNILEGIDLKWVDGIFHGQSWRRLYGPGIEHDFIKELEQKSVIGAHFAERRIKWDPESRMLKQHLEDKVFFPRPE